MSSKVLFLGEIVGRAGLTAVKKFLPSFRQEEKIDLVVANAEGTTGGFGLGKNHALYLRKLGVDVVTVGEKGFFKKDLTELMGKSAFLLRPANFPPEVPGRGYRLTEINGQKIAVISLLGQNGFTRMHLNNPFHTMNYLLEKLKDNDTILVEFHAATTAEKQAMACFLESKDFEDALSMAVSIGGDADTLGAITGGLAEAFYGWTEEEARRMWSWLIPFQGKRPRYVVEEGPLRQFLALAHAKFPGKFPNILGL